MKKPTNKKAAAKPAAEPKKKGRPPGKTTKAAKPAKVTKAHTVEAAKAAIGHNSADPKLRAIFLDYLPKVEKLRKRIASVTGELRSVYKDAKRDGFEKFQFDIGLQLADPEGEAKFKENVRKQLQAAAFIDAAYGQQLDMFGEPDRTPAVDRAYDEGQKASMENRQAAPSYDPSTPQYARYLEGFHDNEAKKLAGMKKKETAATKLEKAAKADVPTKAKESAPSAPVIPITRAAILAQQNAAEHIGDVDEDAESEDVEGTDDDAPGGFAKRA